MAFDTSKYEETRQLWKDYNEHFKNVVYPDLFAPYNIPFSTAYFVYCAQHASYNWTWPGPPNTCFVPNEEEEDEPWKN